MPVFLYPSIYLWNLSPTSIDCHISSSIPGELSNAVSDKYISPILGVADVSGAHASLLAECVGWKQTYSALPLYELGVRQVFSFKKWRTLGRFKAVAH